MRNSILDPSTFFIWTQPERAFEAYWEVTFVILVEMPSDSCGFETIVPFSTVSDFYRPAQSVTLLT